MKRRKFLAASVLTLLGGHSLAAPAKSTVKPAAKPATKPAAKPAGKPSNGRNTATAKPNRYSPAQPVRKTPVNTADHSVIDAPPPGSSASRLPPVRAPELPELWQDFEISTTLTVRPSLKGSQRLLLPLPLNQNTLYQRNLGFECKSNGESVRVQRLPDGEQEILTCIWPSHTEGKITLINRISIAERNFDVTRRSMPPEREDILRRYLRATPTIPNEGEIYDLAMKILGRIKDPVAQAKALFEWVTENTAYLPDLLGGGTGDVAQQVNTGRFGGGSVDIAALFVGLCRSMGIPARLVFGLRIDRSLISDVLSANPDDLQRDQHCRAEFYIPGYSWIAVDPANVCRASNQGFKGKDLATLRRIMFGTWEMNWMAYSMATDLTLPGSRTSQPFFNLPVLISPAEGLQTVTPTLASIQQYQVRSQRTLGTF